MILIIEEEGITDYISCMNITIMSKVILAAAISDCEHMLILGSQVLVNMDSTNLIKLNSSDIKPHTLNIRSSSTC